MNFFTLNKNSSHAALRTCSTLDNKLSMILAWLITAKRRQKKAIKGKSNLTFYTILITFAGNNIVCPAY